MYRIIIGPEGVSGRLDASKQPARRFGANKAVVLGDHQTDVDDGTYENHE